MEAFPTTDNLWEPFLKLHKITYYSVLFVENPYGYNAWINTNVVNLRRRLNFISKDYYSMTEKVISFLHYDENNTAYYYSGY